MRNRNKKRRISNLDYNTFSRINEGAADRIELLSRNANANLHLLAGEVEMNCLGKQFARASRAQLAGRVAEVQQAATFNADAALKGLTKLAAATSASRGQPLDPSDILILDKGLLVDKAQVKFCGNAEKTARQLSQPKYQEMQKVAPADQVRGARVAATRLSRKNAETRPEIARNYEDTAKRVKSRVEYGKASSTPLGRKEARNLARQAARGKATLAKFEEGSMLGEVCKASGAAAISGAKFAGITTLACSGVDNAQRWYKGDMTAGEAVIETTGAAAVSAIDGAAKAAMGTAIKCGAEAITRTIGREATKSVARETLKSGVGRLASANVAFALGSVAVDTASGIVKVCTGDITPGECAKKVGNSAATTGGAMAGGKIGAALGSMLCPGAGTFVGGIVGGLFGSLSAGSLFSGIFD